MKVLISSKVKPLREVQSLALCLGGGHGRLVFCEIEMTNGTDAAGPAADGRRLAIEKIKKLPFVEQIKFSIPGLACGTQNACVM